MAITREGLNYNGSGGSFLFATLSSSTRCRGAVRRICTGNDSITVTSRTFPSRSSCLTQVNIGSGDSALPTMTAVTHS